MFLVFSMVNCRLPAKSPLSLLLRRLVSSEYWRWSIPSGWWNGSSHDMTEQSESRELESTEKEKLTFRKGGSMSKGVICCWTLDLFFSNAFSPTRRSVTVRTNYFLHQLLISFRSHRSIFMVARQRPVRISIRMEPDGTRTPDYAGGGLILEGYLSSGQRLEEFVRIAPGLAEISKICPEPPMEPEQPLVR